MTFVVVAILLLALLSAVLILSDVNRDMGSVCRGWPESDEDGDDECGI